MRGTVSAVLATFYDSARTTAIYPNQGENLAYVALGLVDEAIEAFMADDSEKIAELGDVVWYLTMLQQEAPEAIALSEIDARVEADRVERATAACSGGDVTCWWAHLVKHAGLVAGRAKKAQRDGAVDAERLSQATAEVAIAIDRLGQHYGASLELLCAQVMEKLRSRAARGVIRGDGDHR